MQHVVLTVFVPQHEPLRGSNLIEHQHGLEKLRLETDPAIPCEPARGCGSRRRDARRSTNGWLFTTLRREGCQTWSGSSEFGVAIDVRFRGPVEASECINIFRQNSQPEK